MELTFLMWNLKKKGNTFISAITEVLEKYKPDFLLLSETDINDNQVHEISNGKLKTVMLNKKKSIRLYVNPGLDIALANEEEVKDERRRQIKDRLVFFNLKINDTKIVLAGVHFPSKFMLEYNIMKRWHKWIQGQEILFGTKHSIIFGDLNLNPFDYAIYRDGGLNAHPTIKHKTRVKPVYYNPMWSTLGDFIYKSNSEKIPGSYFFDIDEDNATDFHWNSIDGVLIKESLEPNFVKNELEIITETENHIFASNHEIYSKKYSDHLPVKFKIKL